MTNFDDWVLRHTVFTQFWDDICQQDLNPFQNPTLGYRCEIDNTSETHLKQKIEELIDLDNDSLKQVLTPEEMARIAGKHDQLFLCGFFRYMY